jgi:mevalonate kinase
MLATFPAKVLLLGEYTILNGSKALALPYDSLSGKWSFDPTESEARTLSRKSLLGFIKNSSAPSVDLARMEFDFLNGLWFDSSIPQGFGLGSSGAVIAAIYQRYGSPTGVIEKDKHQLARLEDFFHGSSSGLDPLVSHIKKPLLIHSFSDVEELPTRPGLKGFFLLNSGKPRNTGPLVSIYQEKMKDPQFKQGCADVLSREVNLALDAVLKGDRTHLFHHLWHISKFQWDFFPEMIPTKERGPWTKGLETGDYVLKLCGAGGGGFILGYSIKYSVNQMRSILGNYELRDLA